VDMRGDLAFGRTIANRCMKNPSAAARGANVPRDQNSFAGGPKKNPAVQRPIPSARSRFAVAFTMLPPVAQRRSKKLRR
jgi:hypothetical protein